MTTVTEILDPLRTRVSVKNAFLGVTIGLVLFVFALFLPWASVSAALAKDGGSSSGWAEGGYWALLPLLVPMYRVVANRRPMRMVVLLPCLALALLVLAVNNISDRSQWRRPYRMIGSVFVDGANYGSSLDVGFWLGLASLLVISLSVIAWTLHRAADGVGPKMVVRS